MFEDIGKVIATGFERARRFLERVKEYENKEGVKRVYDAVVGVLESLPADIGIMALIYLAKRYHRALTDDVVEYALGVAGAVTLVLDESDMNLLSSPVISSAVIERANDLVHSFMSEVLRRIDDVVAVVKRVEEVVRDYDQFDIAVATVYLFMGTARSVVMQLEDPLTRASAISAIAMVVGIAMISPDSAESFIRSTSFSLGVM